MTLLFGLGVCNKEIKSSTVLQQQSAVAVLSLCLLEVQSYWFFAIFQPVDSRDSQIADIVTGKQKYKIDLVRQQLLENESARDNCEHEVCFILVTVSICKVSLWQCCRVSFLTILWPFNLVLQVVCMECFASEYVLLLGAFEVPTDSYRLGSNHALDVVKMVCKTQVEEMNRLMYKK